MSPALSKDAKATITEAVLDLVDAIPTGRVMSYGAIAECLRDRGLRCSARQVGRVMALCGGAVAWHRVVGADGRLVPALRDEATQLLRSEDVPFRGNKVAMASAQWWPGQ